MIVVFMRLWYEYLYSEEEIRGVGPSFVLRGRNCSIVAYPYAILLVEVVDGW